MNDGSKTDRVYGFVLGKVKYLSADTPSVRAMLAKLRRGVGKPLNAYPEAWGVVLDGLDEDLLSYRGEPSKAENAIWTALTLFAIHQQGNLQNKQDHMNKEGNSFGDAVRCLIAPDGSNEKAVRRRFDAVITAKDSLEVSHHARGLIQLFKAGRIPLDYPMFAKDLYKMQFDEGRTKILLRWGEDSYRKRKEDNMRGGENPNEQ